MSSGIKITPDLLEAAADMLDRDCTSWVDEEHKPKSCYVCPFSIWERDYKRCSVLKQWLHPLSRKDARLKICPVKINGLICKNTKD